MATTQSATDPAMQQQSPSGVPQASASSAAIMSGPNAPVNVAQSLQNMQLSPAQEQVLALLSRVPELLKTGEIKDAAAAEALSNLSQTAFAAQTGQMPAFQTHMQQHVMSEPGPSSHPRGPPNLGQGLPNAPPPLSDLHNDMDMSDGGGEMNGDQHSMESVIGPNGEEKPSSKNGGGRRSGRSATMSNDEWARQRKDNHKEVERRRRGNINEGINELGRIVPNGSGEKAKGAILNRAVQYIHHLKENEARNIEKWTLEKLLMDQAMGDLQAQLEEMRRLWEEERMARQRAEGELDVLRGMQGHVTVTMPDVTRTTPPGGKRPRDDGEEEEQEEGGEDAASDRSKRQKIAG